MADLISIVVPVYNGENSLDELYSAVKNTAAINKLEFELILIDDRSRDQSYQKILKLHSQDSRVKGIRLAQNYGQQNAIFCGFNYTVGDYIITMDDDLQHRPQDIALLYQQIKKGYDVVYAIPEERAHNFYRRLGSKLTNCLFNLITPKDEEIRVSSFRIITREVLKKVIASDKSFIYLSAIILKEEPEIANIYTRQEQRKYGQSNYNFLKLLKLFLKLYVYYGKFPFLKYLRRQKRQYIIEESTFI
ncbi:undecaprenyl-phosphate 4-deoxy-4-formamido-L-arabinose transferase [Halanaerobium saccharolyticum]|uniref:Undecaprenyl-phosphate 4-deoxy-4-formamido-L-arabinose transferase n=1 Tax=Halanaerobium saccharolyticum TaxID=43595 RepID=A0A4R7Z680_9FIRM|nr:glycosyltransferase family 2 protein [Halanaerobium saccharolyticum]RAK04199.1 undecaprenyl-phosphate 4-deoxy-4-formamido-L-arabinose transferase [Halanaerobium saccharolyticum]TDW06778.1 undecaprenyl-phosphate 4-deoxy-4-formamido-L-arabinose transferase [Halanaerobium saccharolyticum]TDX62413.1 undecaprenyl-phosphate 4-deoxy-4-formamido-L-arabinose transferase [Halanaerobium saccharolyticum]